MRKKNFLIGAAMLAAVSLAGSFSAEELTERAAAMAAGESMTQAVDVSDASDGEWHTDIRMGINREHQLIAGSGMGLDEWDASVAQMKREGLEASCTEESLREADPRIRILEKDGQIYQISGSSAFAPVTGPMEAYRMAYSLVKMLGGSKRTDLRLWSVIDVNGKEVYSFQQISGSEEVLGSILKIATDENDRVTAVFASLDPESTREENLVTREQAEEAVLDHILEETGKTVQVLDDLTDRTIYMPVDMAQALNLDSDEEDPVPNMVLWVVYTENRTGSGQSEEAAAEREAYPYLANYVKLDGTFVKSLAVKEPGDTDSLDGYRRQDVFAGMEAGTYTGKITGRDDETFTITVPVMHSVEDGNWYLGDLSRRIAVADFYEAAYSEDHDLKLVSTKDNTGWDNEDLFMYLNYIRAWDFYADMGWIGPDGQGTDVIILKDMCTSDGTLYENACSVGKVENWQMFGYTGYNMDGTPLGLARGLDVMAHEYTHTFTATVMNTNLYENDQGAINEAMSDIMGNLTEYICRDTEDKNWALGENTGMVIRSMSDPNAFQQPEYVWDVFYGPHTDEPATANDRGGVHSNSSLLNRIGALLCKDHGMSLEDAAAFWTMTAVGMTPRTDYVQIPALLGWALEESGNEAFAEPLQALIDEERLSSTQLPEKLPYDRKLVRLQLPDTEAFKDENWGLFYIQLNTEKLGHIGGAVFETLGHMFMDGDDLSGYLDILSRLADNLHLDGTKLKLDSIEDEEGMLDAVTELFTESLSGILIQGMGWEENSSGEMTVMIRDYPTVYALMNITKSGTQINDLAILFNDRWIDLGIIQALNMMQPNTENPDDLLSTVENVISMVQSVIEDFGEEPAPEQEALTEPLQEETEEMEVSDTLDTILELIETGLNVADYYLTDEAKRPPLEELFARPTKAEYLPTRGLENITLEKQ